MHPIFVEIRKQLADGVVEAERWIDEQWWEAFVYAVGFDARRLTRRCV